MGDYYVGLTIRKEVLDKDGISLDLDTLKTIAVEAMEHYLELMKQTCPEITIRSAYTERLGIQEYRVEPETNLKIRLSLEPENYAPFNSWIEVNAPNSKEWALLSKLARHLSRRFPKLTFNVASSFFAHPGRAEDEKYTLLFKNGRLKKKLTRQEWAETYLGTRFPRGYIRNE